MFYIQEYHQNEKSYYDNLTDSLCKNYGAEYKNDALKLAYNEAKELGYDVDKGQEPDRATTTLLLKNAFQTLRIQDSNSKDTITSEKIKVDNGARGKPVSRNKDFQGTPDEVAQAIWGDAIGKQAW